MSVATLTTNPAQALNSSPAPSSIGVHTFSTDAESCESETMSLEALQDRALSTSGRLNNYMASIYPDLVPPSTEILGIFRRSHPNVSLNPVAYPIEAPITTRQWHPTILMPSHMRYIQAIAACWRLRSISQPTFTVRITDYQNGKGPPLGGVGQAAPAA